MLVGILYINWVFNKLEQFLNSINKITEKTKKLKSVDIYWKLSTLADIFFSYPIWSKGASARLIDVIARPRYCSSSSVYPQLENPLNLCLTASTTKHSTEILVEYKNIFNSFLESAELNHASWLPEIVEWKFFALNLYSESCSPNCINIFYSLLPACEFSYCFSVTELAKWTRFL